MDEEKKSSFIKEKIVKRPLTPEERWKKIGGFVLAALFFGAIAGASFAVANYMVKKGLQSGQDASFSIPEDDPEGSSESESETGTEEETPETAVSQTDSFEQWQKNLEKQAAVSLVKVQVEGPSEELFAEEKRCIGAIIGKSGDTYMILCPWSPLQSAESISVQLYNGAWRTAEIKGKDTVTDIAVLSVSMGNQPLYGADLPVPLALGNSYQVSKGDRVLAVGSPYGILDSVAAGRIVGIDQEEDQLDGPVRMLYTDVGAAPGGAGFLLDKDGNLIGILNGESGSEDGSPLTGAVGISELKQSISVMCQGKDSCRFGVLVQVVDSTISKEKNLPEGLYVTEVLQGSPAYEARIQVGDVITALDGQEIKTVKDYRSALLAHQPEDKVTVTVMRSGKDGYSPIDFSATLGSR